MPCLLLLLLRVEEIEEERDDISMFNYTLEFEDFGRERFEERCRLESVCVLRPLRVFLDFLVVVGGEGEEVTSEFDLVRFWAEEFSSY